MVSDFEILLLLGVVTDSFVNRYISRLRGADVMLGVLN